MAFVSWLPGIYLFILKDIRARSVLRQLVAISVKPRHRWQPNISLVPKNMRYSDTHSAVGLWQLYSSTHVPATLAEG
jgi:hypothetical protein